MNLIGCKLQFLNSTARLMIITSHTITNLVFDELMFLISTTATTTETNIVPSTKVSVKIYFLQHCLLYTTLKCFILVYPKVNRHIHGCLQKSARGKSYASRWTANQREQWLKVSFGVWNPKRVLKHEQELDIAKRFDKG